MHPPPPGSLLVLMKSGRQQGRTHQQVADRDQPLQGPRVGLPAAALPQPPGPLRLALALPLGGEGGQLGLGAAAVGLPHECPLYLSPADVVAVPTAPHPRHGCPLLVPTPRQAAWSACRQADHQPSVPMGAVTAGVGSTGPSMGAPRSGSDAYGSKSSAAWTGGAWPVR